MKKIFCLLIISLFLNCKTDNEIIADPITQKAQFKFDIDTIPKIIYSNLNLTKERGNVIFRIEIDSTGNASEPIVMKSSNENLNAETLRVARLIPNEWVPAKMGNKNIKSYYLFMIKFTPEIKNKYSR